MSTLLAEGCRECALLNAQSWQKSKTIRQLGAAPPARRNVNPRSRWNCREARALVRRTARPKPSEHFCTGGRLQIWSTRCLASNILARNTSSKRCNQSSGSSACSTLNSLRFLATARLSRRTSGEADFPVTSDGAGRDRVCSLRLSAKATNNRCRCHHGRLRMPTIFDTRWIFARLFGAVVRG